MNGKRPEFISGLDRQPNNKLICIEVKFIFDSLRLGLSSSANILQIADAALRVVFLLFLLLLRLVPAVVFTLETSEVSAIFIFHNQNNSASFPRYLNL